MSLTVPYPNAPITEAMIDIRTRFAAEAPLDMLQRFGELIKSDYPERRQLNYAVGQMTVGPEGGSAAVDQKIIGYTFNGANNKQFAQARVDGFTFNRLAPYESWEPFRDEARRLWDLYRKTTQSEQIVKLGVRYINRIDIPEPEIDLKEYFRTVPELPAELPQHLAGFFQQLQLPIFEVRGLAIITQTIVPPVSKSVISVILDIDFFRDQEPPQSEAEIWCYFDSLREWKDKIFESCITNSTRKLFETCSS